MGRVEGRGVGWTSAQQLCVPRLLDASRLKQEIPLRPIRRRIGLYDSEETGIAFVFFLVGGWQVSS